MVIYPPVEIVSRRDEALPRLYNGEYFLVVSRLSPYKKVDIVVEAFNKLDLPLVVIGEGQQEKHLRKIAKDNIKILGWQNDETIAQHYANARAFIFPAEDDFGMTVVEAMAHGVPVIAFGKGGALEIMQEGINGELFAAQTPEVLADGGGGSSRWRLASRRGGFVRGIGSAIQRAWTWWRSISNAT